MATTDPAIVLAVGGTALALDMVVAMDRLILPNNPSTSNKRNPSAAGSVEAQGLL